MVTATSSEETTHAKPRRLLPRLIGGTLKFALVTVIVVAAAAAFRHQMKTSPRAQRQTPPRQAKLVEVIPVQKGSCTTTVRAMGPVIPAQQVTLHPQVSGRIMEISDAAIPGGIVHAGQTLMAVDRRDYEILVQQRHADVAKALKDLKVEQGNQAVAKQEYELLGEIVTEEDQELVLREPQLASAQSALESAQAALQKAELDLSRCDITVPFNAIIREKLVDIGATVSSGTSLVSLIATDEAWVELKVPIDQLKWLAIPLNNGEPGSTALIYNTLAWGPDRSRAGRILRLQGEIEAEGKQARLLATVDDPFCLKPENHDAPKLLMGSFVQAQIQGRTLESVFPISRSHVRDNNTVWILDDESQLQIRPVQVAYRGPEEIFVSDGLVENEQLVTTDIAAPVPGMPLRIAGTEGERIERNVQVAHEEGTRQ
jgi:RND family efflux transporter MFP subunit